MEQKYIDALLEMGNEMHPHLGNDNHTNRLIRQLVSDKSKLTKSEFFDLGKYYDRMFPYMLRYDGTERGRVRLHAILELKWACH